MPWWAWMLLGAVCVVAATYVVIVVLDWLDDRQLARERAIRNQQTEAERRLQASVQHTITQMFEAVRWRP